jgi:phage terminase large subunit-like protein
MLDRKANTSTGEDTDETGIVVAGKDANGHGYVLADQSLLGRVRRSGCVSRSGW